MAASAALLIAALALAGCARQRIYAPAKPPVGAQATVRIEVRRNLVLPPRNLHRPGPPWRGRLVIRCVKARGAQRQFAVYDAVSSGRRKPIYTVWVNYESRSPLSAAEVRDAKGHIVPRGKEVGGIPVVFYDWFVLDTASLEAVSRSYHLLKRGYGYHTRLGGPTPEGRWRATLNYGRASRPAVDFHEYQEWRSGDWLWSAMSRVSYAPDKVKITATRE